MKSILFTGAMGNLGSWVLDHLTKANFEVTILTKKKRDLTFSPNVEIIQCDIADRDDVSGKLNNKSFDYVIHMASVNDGFVDNYPRLALEVNAWGTRNLLEALAGSDLKNFIYFSTFQVYGAYSGTITEETPTLPKHDYGTSHLFAEEYIKQFHKTHSLPYTIFRLTNSYGCPKDYDSSKWYLILNDLSKTAFETKEIVLKSNGLAPRDFIWMGTVAQIIQDTIKKDASNDTYNISGQNTMTMLEVAESVQSAYLRKYGESIPVKTNQEDKTVHPDDLLVKSEKLRGFIDINDTAEFENEATAIFEMLEKK